MLRITKTKTYTIMFVAVMLQVFLPGFDAKAADGNTDFQVQVNEGLSVDITPPSNWAAGITGTLITNKINIAVTSNNHAGYHVSMVSSTATPNLVNALDASATLSTLSADWDRESSVTNFWGYSTDDVTYKPIVGLGSASPTRLLDSANSGSGSVDVYFGAKTDVNQAPGTYTGKVLISIVTGYISEDNPITPINPVAPVNENGRPYYTNDSNTTTYTTRTADNSTHTEITSGDTRTSYTAPQGEVVRSNGSFLPAILFGSVAIATTSGVAFFILAKRRKDDDEEDEEGGATYS